MGFPQYLRSNYFKIQRLGKGRREEEARSRRGAPAIQLWLLLLYTPRGGAREAKRTEPPLLLFFRFLFTCFFLHLKV
jgi:hypothetical protein